MLRGIAPLILVAMAAATSGSDKVPLPLELPKPLFVGTPVPFKLPNLEQPTGVKRPPFLVPTGTVNLALGKPVTASDTDPLIGEIPFVTDGNKKGTEGTYVELGPGLQWVQIDLGAPATLYAIVCWHFHAQARAYLQMIVQVSDDPEFKKGVVTLFNNDDKNKAGFGVGTSPAYLEKNTGRVIPANKAVARYVRLYSAGNTANELNHYIEVEVFGRPRP